MQIQHTNTRSKSKFDIRTDYCIQKIKFADKTLPTLKLVNKNKNKY